MGLTKPNGYTNDELDFSRIGRAIAHPARNRIIELLLDCHFVRNTDLSNYLNLSQAMVTKHIDTLKDAKIVTCVYHVHYDQLVLNEEMLDYYYERTTRWYSKLKSQKR